MVVKPNAKLILVYKKYMCIYKFIYKYVYLYAHVYTYMHKHTVDTHTYILIYDLWPFGTVI